MEMNRYLIAALYVMAGCVVAVPLKQQGNILPSEREGYGVVISNATKVISFCLDKKTDHPVPVLEADINAYFSLENINYACEGAFRSLSFSLAETEMLETHPIRAPETERI